MSDSLAIEPKNPAAIKLNVDGATAHGVITYVAERQARDFQTKEPKFYSDGNPVMEIVIHIQQADGQLGTVYAGSGLKKAIIDAVIASGARAINKGDTLSVRFTGKQANARGQYVNTYQAVYQPAPVNS